MIGNKDKKSHARLEFLFNKKRISQRKYGTLWFSLVRSGIMKVQCALYSPIKKTLNLIIDFI